MNHERRIEVAEHPEVPLLSIVLGYGPMLPIAAAAAGSLLLTGDLRTGAIQCGGVYAAFILAFLGGVRRGVSFRTEGGPRVSQIITMALLWLIAFVAMLCVNAGMQDVALAILILGFGLVACLDPIAAREGEAPLFFARLRRPQMVIAVASLVALLVGSLRTV